VFAQSAGASRISLQPTMVEARVLKAVDVVAECRWFMQSGLRIISVLCINGRESYQRDSTMESPELRAHLRGCETKFF